MTKMRNFDFENGSTVVDFSVTFYVYTKEVMPTKSARVSTECTIATHHYNNDTVTVI